VFSHEQSVLHDYTISAPEEVSVYGRGQREGDLRFDRLEKFERELPGGIGILRRPGDVLIPFLD
jgi:hypothetical protein